jgi:transcription initiation factor TFIIF subunit alpha
MGIQRLIGQFKGRVDKDNSKAFIAMVKAVTILDSERKWLTPKPWLPSEESIRETLETLETQGKLKGK